MGKKIIPKKQNIKKVFEVNRLNRRGKDMKKTGLMELEIKDGNIHLDGTRIRCVKEYELKGGSFLTELLIKMDVKPKRTDITEKETLSSDEELDREGIHHKIAEETIEEMKKHKLTHQEAKWVIDEIKFMLGSSIIS